MSKLFKKHFKTILNEELNDQEAFESDFQNQNELENLNQEIQNISPDPEANAKIIKLADKYSDKITNYILPIMRKLHQDLTSGIFKSVAPDIKGISNITEDLAALAEALRGRVRDSVIKQDKEQSNANK